MTRRHSLFRQSHVLAAIIVGSLCASPARAVTFEFIYADPGGVGFTDPVLGAQRRAAMEYAGAIWGSLIKPSYPGETVTVRAQFDSNPNTFGKANSDLFYANFGSSNPVYRTDTHYPKALASHLNGADVEPGRHDIDAVFGLTQNFYYGTDGAASPGQFDFVSLALHELAHGLGFSESFRGNGAYGVFGDGTYDVDDEVSGLPTPYDRYLTVGPGGTPLLNLNWSQRASAMVSNNVFWSGPSGAAGNAGAPPKIFAPTTYNAGSSISHIDQATFNGAVMTPSQPPGVVWQTPYPVERGMLRDIGWDLSLFNSTHTWSGAGPNNAWSTPANWTSNQLPRYGDSVSFGPSSQTTIDVNFDGAGEQKLMFFDSMTFAPDAPLYTLNMRGQSAVSLNGAGIVTLGSQSPTIHLNSSFQTDATSDGKAAGLTFALNASAGDANYILRGGGTTIDGISPPHGTLFFVRHRGASITFESNATAGSASFEVEGGRGDGGPGATVTFRGASNAGSAEYRNRGGLIGSSLPVGTLAGGFGGETRFEDSADAGSATFHNYGQAEHRFGSAGFTTFMDNTNAGSTEIVHGTFHNHGSTINAGQGGVTRFFETSTAGAARVFNHADGDNGGGAALTLFADSSNAGTAWIENEGSSSQLKSPGRTEFRGNSSADRARINNRGFITVGDAAGRTFFYDDSTAANSTLRTFNGLSDHGRIEFRDRSTAADANIFLETEPAVVGSRGGYLNFYDNSTAATSNITLRAGNSGFGGLQFYNNATAADAQVVVDDSGGPVVFLGTSSAGDPLTAPTPATTANFSLGASNVMSFYDQSTAADATITLANRAQLFFQNNSSAGQAQITAAGGSVYTAGAQAVVTFNSNSTADGATILATGATAPLASPGAVVFMNGAHAAQSTIIANSGSDGGDGATITFSNANGDAARVIAHAGSTVDFLVQPTFNNGSTTLGSIQGAGRYVLRGSHLIAGSLGETTTVSGPITDNPNSSPFYSGGRLTKVGTGTLTLAGANTYSGVTTVNAGTLRVDGSLVGPVVVNNGGTLIGDEGDIPAGVMVNSGGAWSPGASPGTISVGGFAMTPGSTLNYELGATLRDRIVVTGNGAVSLGGTLNISFLDGFVPAPGQTFSLFEGDVGSVTGAFSSVIAPIFNGMTLGVTQSASSVALQVVDSAFQPADFNRDGVVNAADLTNWRGGFGSGGAATQAHGDADGDADVDGADFLTWQRQVGSAGATPDWRAVPEPGAGVLVCLGMMVMMTAKRRRAASCGAVALTLALTASATADYTTQDNIAFNAKKVNPYNGGPAWHFEDTIPLFDERLAPGGPVTVGPLDADPLGLALEALLGVDLPHVVKLKTGASLSGHAQANFGYYVTGGRLDISYPASASLNFETAPGTTDVVQANQTYTVDGGFQPGVSQRFVPSQFLQTSGGAGYATAPLRSQTDYQQPWFETQSPWASAWVEASADIQASIFTKVSALGGLKEWRKDIRAGGKVGGRLVEIDPTGLYVAGSAEPDIGLNVFEPIGPIPIGGGAADLTFQVPNIAVSSVTNPLPAQNGVIAARKEQPLIKLAGNLENLIPLVGPILQKNIGPLGYDLLNVAGGPELKLYQEMTFTPDPRVRLNFSEPVLAGAGDVPTIEAEFDLDEAISWKPMFSNSRSITVTPTYLLNNTFRNKTGLKVDLVVDVEALSLTGEFPPFNGTLGPLYEKQLTIPIVPDVELFAPAFNIPLGSVTAGSVPGIGPITTGAITFQKSNLDIEVGLGDLELLSSQFLSSDPNNSDIQTHQLQFAREVQGGPPRLYTAPVTGLFGMIAPEGPNVGAYLVSAQDVFVEDDVTGRVYNLGRSFVLDEQEFSAPLPSASPSYLDPILGPLYLSTQPDDLSNVPGVDINPVGHPKLDRYNSNDDIRKPDEKVYDTGFVDRRLGPDTTILTQSIDFSSEGDARLGPAFGFSINNAGQTAVWSSLELFAAGQASLAPRALHLQSGDAAAVEFVRDGDPAPGGGVIELGAGGTFHPSAVNESGQVAVTSLTMAYRAGAGSIVEIARLTQPLPDGNGGFLGFNDGALLNDAGQVVFQAAVGDVGQQIFQEAIYRGQGGALTKIARTGDILPGLTNPTTSLVDLALNVNGRVAFRAGAPGVAFGTEWGLYVGDGTTPTRIALSGDAVPHGGTIASFDNARDGLPLNSASEVAFMAYLDAPQVFPGDQPASIYRGNGGPLVEIARAGVAAPDNDGVLRYVEAPAINDAGQVAFWGFVETPSTDDYSGYFIGSGGTLTRVMRGGMSAPDGNGQLASVDEGGEQPLINSPGHVAFRSFLQNTAGGSAADNEGLFVWDGANVVQAARLGQPLAGSTIEALYDFDMNDHMQIAYSAYLADGRYVVGRFEPTNYWRATGDGAWGAGDNWSLRVEPRDPYDVFIVAENALTVSGPAVDRTVKSLTLGGDNSATATLALTSGVTLTAVNGTTIRPNGVLAGNGTMVGSVVNGGVVSPGNSPGTLHIDGDYVQTPSGTLQIELASAASRDRIFVDGDITLDGTLTISLLAGFVPALGQSFPLFEGSIGSITGAFDAVNAPLINGVTLNVVQAGGSVMLQAAPFVAGDFNHDGTVDGADLANWEAGYGVASGSATHTQGDADGDADVDGADFLTWQRQLGFSTPLVPTQTSVPEPATALLSLAAFTLPWRRRER